MIGSGALSRERHSDRPQPDGVLRVSYIQKVLSLLVFNLMNVGVYILFSLIMKTRGLARKSKPWVLYKPLCRTVADPGGDPRVPRIPPFSL